jgi:hypothetical protein
MRRKHMTDERNDESTLTLSDESRERLKRLKAKFAKIDDAEIIAVALRGLEEKTDTIIRRRTKKRVMALKAEGLDPKQIADHLNNKGYPSLVGEHQWHGESISMLLTE